MLDENTLLKYTFRSLDIDAQLQGQQYTYTASSLNIAGWQYRVSIDNGRGNDAAEAVRNGPRLSLQIRMAEDQSFTPLAIRLWWVGLLTLHLVGDCSLHLCVGCIGRCQASP